MQSFLHLAFLTHYHLLCREPSMPTSPTIIHYFKIFLICACSAWCGYYHNSSIHVIQFVFNIKINIKHYIELAKSSFGFFRNILWKNPSELFGQPNICIYTIFYILKIGLLFLWGRFPEVGLLGQKSSCEF